MTPEFFDIVVQTEYMIHLKPIENLEDCGDDFLTKEEVEEMGLGTYWHYASPKLMENKVKAKLAEYLADIPKGKKSIIIKDDDLIDALKETETFVSNLIPNTRRTGNRLFKHTKAEKKAQTEVIYKNWTGLINLFTAYCRSQNIEMTITLNGTNRINAITVLKCLAPFDKLKEISDDYSWCSHDEDEWVWMETLYNDPSLSPLPKSKKK